MIKAGQKLHEERILKKLSLEEVAKATRIRTTFLSAIEKGEYHRLPSSAYAQGFVRNYAEYLGLPEKEILALFRREFDEEKIFRVLPEGLARKEEFPLTKIRVQQAVIVTGILLLFLSAFLFMQYRHVFINPDLTLTVPIENAQILGKSVTVSGKTDPNATILINNDSVTVDTEGIFKKTIDVFPGKTTVVIKATNRFGKETTLERHIEVK